MRALPPRWLTDFAEGVPALAGDRFSSYLPTPGGPGRQSAVLVLFAPVPPGAATEDTGRAGLEQDASVIITERAHSMRSHAGQPAFPGGGAEAGDADPAATALREADEEVGLDASGVQLLADLPTLHIPVSGYDVTPVLAWWRDPAPETLHAKDPREVARVVMPTVSWLVTPENRFRVRHPSGYVGPAWDVDGLLVWGFTAGLLDRILDLAGLTRPWDRADIRDLRI